MYEVYNGDGVYLLVSLQEHRTPFHDAVDQMEVDVVKYLVEELQMDISKFDEVYIILM